MVVKTVWLEKNVRFKKPYGLTLKIQAERASLPQTAHVHLTPLSLSVIKD
jgi:hypothetical protein